ncbi:MAG: TatD family hydrolase [Candidatus Nanohalobium sp.]
MEDRFKPVDAHCHLDFNRFDDDREEVVERSREELEFVVNAGCNVEQNRKALELEDRYPGFVVANLGLHPTYTDSFDELEKVKDQIRKQDPVAVGEIGLDHHHVTDEEVRERQRQVFRGMLELAEELGKTVNVHSREAEQEVIDTLNEYSLPDALIHCFNGTPEQAEEAVEKGFTVGVTTQVLYSDRVQDIVERLSLEGFVLETDSPFLYRGGRNEPLNVLESAEKIAEIKNVSTEKVVRTTTQRSRRLFRQAP